MNQNIWNRMKTEIDEVVAARLESGINSPDFASLQHERGWVDALRWVLSLPDKIQGELREENGQDAEKGQNDGHEEEKEQKEKGVITLVNVRPRRTEFFR